MSTPTLFTLTDEQTRLVRYLEDYAECSNGELPPDAEAVFDTIANMQRDMVAKALSIGALVKAYRQEAALHEAEKKAQALAQKRAEAKAEWLEHYLLTCLKPGQELHDGRVRIGWRQSSFVVPMTSLAEMPAQFVRKIEKQEFDKEALKEAAKSWDPKAGEFPYARLETKQNIQIK